MSTRPFSSLFCFFLTWHIHIRIFNLINSQREHVCAHIYIHFIRRGEEKRQQLNENLLRFTHSTSKHALKQCHWQLAMRWNQKANGSIIDTLFPWRRSSVIVLKSWLLCLVVRWMNFVLFGKPTWLSVSHDYSNTFLQLWKLIVENCDTILGRWHLFEHFLCRKIWWFNFANGADQILVCASIRHAKQWNHSTQFTQHKSTSIINFQIQSFHFLSLSVLCIRSFIEFSLFELNVIEPFIIIAITFSSHYTQLSSTRRGRFFFQLINFFFSLSLT